MATKNNTRKWNGQTAAEFQLKYQDNLDNIRSVKSLQWNLTYYALLLYGGIIAFDRASLLSGEVARRSCILLVATIAVILASLYFLCKTQRDIVYYRKYLNSLRQKTFSEEFKDVFDEIERELSRHVPSKIALDSWWHGSSMVIAMMLVSVLSGIAVMVLILDSSSN